MAQKLSGETLTPVERDALRRMAEAHVLPKLENLRQDWSALNVQNARVAYKLSLAAADAMFEDYAAYGISNIVANPGSLGQITAALDKKLGL